MQWVRQLAFVQTICQQKIIIVPLHNISHALIPILVDGHFIVVDVDHCGHCGHCHWLIVAVFLLLFAVATIISLLHCTVLSSMLCQSTDASCKNNPLSVAALCSMLSALAHWHHSSIADADALAYLFFARSFFDAATVIALSSHCCTWC